MTYNQNLITCLRVQFAQRNTLNWIIFSQVNKTDKKGPEQDLFECSKGFLEKTIYDSLVVIYLNNLKKHLVQVKRRGREKTFDPKKNTLLIIDKFALY